MGDRERSSHRSRDNRSRDDRPRDDRRDSHRSRESSKRPRYDSDDDERDRERRHRRETSEERRTRRMAKRDARAARDQKAREKAAELHGYAAEGENAFGDAALDQKFVWAKKDERDRKAGLSREEAAAKDMRRRVEAKEELERLNKRRAERAVELRQREQDEAQAARQSQSAQQSEWIAKEDEFRLTQSMKRAEIRVREHRAKPIDFLAINLKWSNPAGAPEEDEGEGLDIDLEEPYAIFDNITLEETDELEADIRMYLSLEKGEASLDFWRSMLLVCASVLEERRSERQLGHQLYAERRRASAGVKAQIATLLAGKTYDELAALQIEVQRKLASREPIDVEYWENLLKELVVWKAKSRLRDMHEIVLRNRLEHLRRRQRDEALFVQRELDAAARTRKDDSQLPEPFVPGMDPPLLTSFAMADQKITIVLDADQRRELVIARRAVAGTRFVPKRHEPGFGGGELGPAAPTRGTRGDNDAAAEAQYRAEAEMTLDSDEEFWNDEDVAVFGEARQAYLWEDKYRPRKPRYLNKVVSGYNWSQYNQTHYDQDNPPPKVVQGYKINLFLPDLIDPTQTPTFKVVRDPGNEETCLLVFHCGAPYEDIAFRIINDDWDHKHGFRCTFDPRSGVLSLSFTFKKIMFER